MLFSSVNARIRPGAGSSWLVPDMETREVTQNPEPVWVDLSLLVPDAASADQRN